MCIRDSCMVVLMISLGIAQTKTNEEMLQSWGDLTQVQVYGCLLYTSRCV